MNKLKSVFILIILATSLPACTQGKYGNTPEQQRQNSQDAQRELSTDVSR